eukprot:253001-Rhodomonas_salina.1
MIWTSRWTTAPAIQGREADTKIRLPFPKRPMLHFCTFSRHTSNGSILICFLRSSASATAVSACRRVLGDLIMPDIY